VAVEPVPACHAGGRGFESVAPVSLKDRKPGSRLCIGNHHPGGGSTEAANVRLLAGFHVPADDASAPTSVLLTSAGSDRCSRNRFFRRSIETSSYKSDAAALDTSPALVVAGKSR
jgi:hypothetical protein